MIFSLTGARSAVHEKAANGSHYCSTVPQNVKAACGVLINDLMELFRDRPGEGRETLLFYINSSIGHVGMAKTSLHYIYHLQFLVAVQSTTLNGSSLQFCHIVKN